MNVNRKPLGDAGLNENANNLNRTVEHLIELQGRLGSIKYRQMAHGDSMIGMILRAHKNAIRSAAWDIPKPDNVTDIESECIDVISDILLGKTGTKFDILLGQILSFMEYGFSCFEQYYEPYEDAETGKLFLAPCIKQRMQTSIQDIFPQWGYIRQMTIDKGLIPIPIEDMVFFILNQQGEDMRGESLLRNIYADWKAKKIFEEWLGIGIQRSASGVPSMEVPVGTKVDSDDYRAAEQLLQNITFHENAYMITQTGWKFTYNESKFNAEQVQNAIDAKNTSMAMSVLTQFVMLGQTGGGGSFALSRDQSDMFLDGLLYFVNLITNIVNDEIIAPFIQLNYGDAVDPSRVCLTASNINKKSVLDLSTTLVNLTQAQFIKANVDDEIQIRKMLMLPELTDEEVEQRRELQDNPPPPPVSTTVAPGAVQSVPAPIIPPEYVPTEEQKSTAARLRGLSVKFTETNRTQRQNLVNKNESEMTDFMQANLLLVKDKMLADIEAVLNRGAVQIQGLKTIEASTGKYTTGLQKKLAGIATESYSRAKANAKSNNVKFSEDGNVNDIQDPVLKQFVLNQTQSVIDQQTSTMVNRAILTASNGSLKGYATAQIISNVSKVIDAYLAQGGVSVAGSLVVVGTMNFGEMQFYKGIEDQLWGYVFSNEDPVSQICQWYNNKTFSVNSPELAAATPPLHPNCKSYLDPIYKSNVATSPTIDDVTAPPSLQDQKTYY